MKRIVRDLAVLATLALAACGGGDAPAPFPSSSGGAAYRPPADEYPRDAAVPLPLSDGGVSPAWESVAPLPAPQQETAVVALRGKVWVIGGFDGAIQPTAAVNVYDPKTKIWTAATPLPEPLHHINASVVGDRIIIAGALRTVAFTAVGTTLSYDPDAGVWSPRTSMPAGSERGGSFVGSVGSSVYVMGGLRGGASVGDVSVYDTATDVWTARASFPATTRDHGMTAVVDGRLYLIGGRGGAIGGHTSAVNVFDPKTGALTARAPMPTSRGGGAAAVAKGLIIVAGGEGNVGASNGVFPEVEAYDAARDAWFTLPAMPTPRHGAGAATIDDVVYVPGGGTTQGFGPTAVVEALRLAP